MTPTRLRLLAGIALVCALLSWSLLHALDVRSGLPDLPWTTPVTIGLLAVVLLVTALTMRPRLRRKPGAKPVPPLTAARLAALALAASRVGAAVFGVYAGFVVALLGELDTAYGRRRALFAVLTVAGSALIVVAALVLERACRLPDDPERRAGGDRGLGSAA